MAAQVDVRIVVEGSGLGNNLVNIPIKFTDTNTPDDYRRIDAVISTTANLLSTLANVASTDIVGMVIVARGDTVFFNTISTNISTAGQTIPEGQGIVVTSILSNSCKFAYKGNADDAAVTLFYWSIIA